MKIGSYTFAEFKDLAARFHGYPAPGLLVGGYMVEMAKAAMPADTLFEVVVETKKCLPDAVQLLTLCSTGNNWMKIVNLGKYALSMFDKNTGIGVRVHIDPRKLEAWPEIYAWFMKKKPKSEQDTEQLLREVEEAGDNICVMTPIRIAPKLIGHAHMGGIALCPACGEAFPKDDGILCRGCQGEAPYSFAARPPETDIAPRVSILPAEEAVGKTLLHDMTRITPGEFKGAQFHAGQTVSVGDVCRLQQMGRFSLAVAEDTDAASFVHENEGAEAFAARMAGKNVSFELPPHEGKINFQAAARGLFSVDRRRLDSFNMLGQVMCATRHDGAIVEQGAVLAATRIIPLYISKTLFAEALSVLDEPLLSVLPLRKARAGILVTGTEVFKGLIEDKFVPVINGKLAGYECEVARSVIVPDDKDAIREGVAGIRAAGADLLITTGGLSVDPEDLTRAALMEAGLTDVLHGAPVLPGSMSLVGNMPAKGEFGAMQVIGVPACALYFKTTLFDALLPRLLANRAITRRELAEMGEGGLCLNCKICTWPKCFFLK